MTTESNLFASNSTEIIPPIQKLPKYNKDSGPRLTSRKNSGKKKRKRKKKKRRREKDKKRRHRQKYKKHRRRHWKIKKGKRKQKQDKNEETKDRPNLNTEKIREKDSSTSIRPDLYAGHGQVLNYRSTQNSTKYSVRRGKSYVVISPLDPEKRRKRRYRLRKPNCNINR